MGIGGLHIWNLLIILLIIVLLFGTNKLRTLGSELGNMLKGFRSTAHNSDEVKPKPVASSGTDDNNTETPKT